MSAGSGSTGYLDILLKAAFGAVLIGVLLTLARLRHYVITGLLVSVPAISLYTWWWIGKEHGADTLRVSVRAAMWSAIPWVAYLAVVYLSVGRLPLWLSLALGVLTWLILATIFAFVLQARP